MVTKFILVLVSSFFLQSQNIAFRLESKTLVNGKSVTVKADVYYKYSEGKMLTHYTYPLEYIIISNRKGEAQVYDPKKNSVSFKRGILFSTDIDIVNLFLTERYFDMGLKDMDFKIASTRNDKGYMVSTWVPIGNADKEIQKIELAHDNELPVYMGIFDLKGKVSKKVYYSNYQLQGQYYIPIRITEISYIDKGDSVINKKEYSGFKLGADAMGGYFDFVVPQNANVLSQ